ncbi:MAG: acetylxylan esterase [Limnochordia bacterium]|nr:acetylxylan esterase [Limnochordia bacterium]
MPFKELERRKLPRVLAPDTTAQDWPKRRDELFALFQEEVYGRMPQPPATVHAETKQIEERAWAGKAIHKEIALQFQTPKGMFSFPVHLVLPYIEEQLPLAIYISFTEYPIGKYAPIEEIVDSGYALATFCYQDVTKDRADGFGSGLAAMYPRDGAKHEWGKISMWAWAASRVLDHVLTLDQVDKRRIFSVGHSRLGKTALWAAVQDERFCAAVANNSGCSGAAISRGKTGEQIANIVTSFPHWFCANYHQYQGREAQLPFDQHQLVAAMAPRPVYVASAVEDLWADPKSEFLSAMAASKAYQLLGLRGLVHEGRFPEPGVSLHEGEIGYHLRAGTHFLSRFDWQQFLKFMDRHLR